MSDISVTLDKNLFVKLQAIAEKSGRSIDECLDLALSEYIENYEDIYKTDLNADSALERSFFLAVGE